MTRTAFTYFSGFGGADIGLEAAGYHHMGGVEWDASIAAVAADNGIALTVADVRSVDPAALIDAAPDWFHASPVCKNASNAKADGAESPEDIDTARAVCRFIEHWKPNIVSIENVWGYRTFAAFQAICDTLTACGYSFDYWHLNAADYGVPQTRKRLILVARRGLCRIQRPTPTHRDGGDMFHPAWVGWYEAIEDLIPTLPASQFAPWQLERLPEYITGSLRDATVRSVDDPSFTVLAGMMRRPISAPSAFIVDGQNAGREITLRGEQSPMFTLGAQNKGSYRAFIVDGQTNDRGESSPIRHNSEPMYTLSATMDKRPARAFLVAGGNTYTPILADDKPAFTIRSGETGGAVSRAWLTTGKVVKMTPRALARFQSFPDTYQLPERNGLACTGVGNAVPPLLMQRLAES